MSPAPDDRSAEEHARILALPDAPPLLPDAQAAYAAPAQSVHAADFLQRAGLRIMAYVPKHVPGHIVLSTCQWQEDAAAPTCGVHADYVCEDPLVHRGAPLCKKHALMVQEMLGKRALDNASLLRAQRAERKRIAFEKRQPPIS